MTQDPPIRDLRLFVQSVRLGSLSGASKAMRLSPNAASLAVKRLESLLGVQLLVRTTRSIALTREGEVYFGQCELVLQALDAAQGSVGPLRDELTGTIRVSAPSDLGRQRIVPLLDAFVAEHPKVLIDLWLSDELFKLVDTRIDVAIRFGTLVDSEFATRRLLQDRRVAVASPSYLAHAPAIAHPRDLVEHQALVWHSSRSSLTRWGFTRAEETYTVAVEAARRANDGVVLREWAIAGHGVVFKAYLDVEKDLASGALVDVLPQWRGAELPLQLVTPLRGLRPARVQRLIRTIHEAFGRIRMATASPTTA